VVKNSIYLLLLIFFLSFPRQAKGELLDRIVAVVNNEVITLSDLNELYFPYTERIRESGYPPDKEQAILFDARQEMLNQLVEQKLADQEISAKQIHVRDEEVANSLEQIKIDNSFTEEELVQMLARDGHTLAEYKKRLREQILRARLVSMEVKSKIVITEHEIQDYYKKHQEKYEGRVLYHIRSILLKTRFSDGKDQTEAALENGKSIAKKIRDGLPFEDAAMEFSEAPSAANGGDLGWFTLDELTPALKDVVQGLEPGEISSVLNTTAGIQIVKLDKKEKTPGKSFEEAKEEIHQELFQSTVDMRYKEWLKDLRETAYIKTML